jgi:hypothetical protein
MKKAWGQTSSRILAVLQEEGPMTKTEICTAIGLHHDHVATIVNRLTKPCKAYGKRIYVKGYVYDAEGERRYPRAIYAFGSAPDARKPKADIKANKRRYLEGLRKRMTANSVFNLGLTRKEYTQVMRGRIEDARVA